MSLQPRTTTNGRNVLLNPIEDSPGGRQEHRWIDDGVNSAIKAIDFTTDLPNKARDFADNLENRITEGLDKIQNKGGQKAKENITKSKIDSTFRKISNWLQSGNNIWWAGAAIIGIIVLIRRA